jgi:predicted metal-binding membrane protein
VTDARSGAFADLLKRDTLIVALALAAITLLAWSYLLLLNGQMHGPATPEVVGMNMAPASAMEGMKMNREQDAMTMAPAVTAWTATHFLFIFVMWAVMMVGMMTPSVSPMVLTYARFARSSAAQGVPFASAAWFAGGYLVAWTTFSLLAALGQWGLDRAALLTPMMAVTNGTLGGSLLIVAGIYQWLPMKGACLSNCRSPFGFVQQHGGFRPDALGSLRLGALHGLYCIGCCWGLMALLFVAGVMNLFWIAALMAIVLAEKLLPAAQYLSRAVGVVAIAGGLWVLAT